MKTWGRVLVMAAALCLLPTAWAQTAGGDAPRLLSRLQSMGHGYHPASEWNAVIGEINGLMADAEAAGDAGRMVDIGVILAEVYSGMLGQHARGLEVASGLKQRLSRLPAAEAKQGMAKLHVKLAEIHARTGNQAAIRQLIEEFRSGPYYDPKDYQVTGLTGPGDPARIQRPYGQGEDSITVTSMNRYLRIAGLAPGNQFPAFAGRSLDQLPVQIPASGPRVVLVDFWAEDWVAWKRDLPNLVSLYARYQDRGFEIIGFPLAVSSPEAVQAIRARTGMGWPQVVGERQLPAQCGVAGEAANFLIDGSGRILARNLRGSELAATLRAHLGE